DYLVMDYIPGDDLLSLMIKNRQKNKFLDERMVLIWSNQLAVALAYLHQQDPPILHRDVKPSNLKLTANDVVKLVDFGLVKILVADEATITIVQGRGTALYTPLEQYGGDAGHTDVRSDIYAFSATLYHLLTNTAPAEARERFLHPGTMPTLRDINPDISQRTERAVLWGMSLHPEERPQSIEEMRKVLFGNWDPVTRPRAALPAPELRDVITSKVERTMMWFSGGLILLSLIATLSH
ncbi:MAG: serine/threonine protein kinase, partial [Chloroflexota bacterium]